MENDLIIWGFVGIILSFAGIFLAVLFGSVYFNIKDGLPGGKQGGEY